MQWMRTLLIVVACSTVLALTTRRAAAECGPFSTDPACVRAAQPGLRLDFWGQAKPKPKPRIAVTRDLQQAAAAALAEQRAHERRQPIDCRMLMRRADPKVDARILTTPPSNVEFLLRTMPVPPCPER